MSDTPMFRDMSFEEKMKLVAARLRGHPIECLEIGHPDWSPLHKFTGGSNLAFIAHYRYRIASTKPSIDWSHVAARFEYLARDADTRGFLYTGRPEEGSFCWSSDGDMTEAEIFASYQPGDCDWRDSLVMRPEAEK